MNSRTGSMLPVPHASAKACFPYEKPGFPYATPANGNEFPYGKHASRTPRQCRNTLPVWEAKLPVCHACAQDRIPVREACFPYTTPRLQPRPRPPRPPRPRRRAPRFKDRPAYNALVSQQPPIPTHPSPFCFINLKPQTGCASQTPRQCRNMIPVREANLPVCHTCQQE